MSRHVKHATARRHLTHNDGREILARIWGYLLAQRVAHRRGSAAGEHCCHVCRDLDLAAHLVLGVAVEEFNVDLKELRRLVAQNLTMRAAVGSGALEVRQ